MKRERLEEIVTQELHSLLEKQKKKTARQKNCPGIAGNEYHDSEGKLSSKADRSSESLYFACKDSKFRTRKGRKAITDPKDSGRGKDKEHGKGRFRIRDDKALYQEEEGTGSSDKLIKISQASLERLMVKTFREIMAALDSNSNHPAKTNNLDQDKLKKVCNRLGRYSFGSFLKKQDLLQRSADGDLFKK
jgi:hypothetical protein